MQVTANEIKSGMKVEISEDPYLVISNQFVKPGKGQAFNRIKLKNIKSKKVLEKTYKSQEKLNLADVEETAMRLIYQEIDNAVFMNDTTYEQISVPFNIIEDNKNWLKEDIVYEIILYKKEVIDITPPIFMELTIKETAPGLRGDTASGRVLKPAVLETGARIQVPIFINEGEKIKVDTRSGEYVARA